MGTLQKNQPPPSPTTKTTPAPAGSLGRSITSTHDKFVGREEAREGTSSSDALHPKMTRDGNANNRKNRPKQCVLKPFKAHQNSSGKRTGCSCQIKNKDRQRCQASCIFDLLPEACKMGEGQRRCNERREHGPLDHKTASPKDGRDRTQMHSHHPLGTSLPLGGKDRNVHAASPCLTSRAKSPLTPSKL